MVLVNHSCFLSVVPFTCIMWTKTSYLALLLIIVSSLAELPTEVCFYHKLNDFDDFIQCGNLRALRDPEKSDDLSNIHRVQIGWNTTLPVVDFGLFTWFTNLTSLMLNNAGIETVQSFAFYNMGELKELNLYNNRISKIEPGTFNQLHQLTVLDLGTNQIMSLEENIFSGLLSLQQLSLSWNNIEHITKGVFNGLQRLRKLNLGGNKIKTLDKDVFQDLTMLKSLDLGFNGLTEIPDLIFSEQINLQILNLESNALRVLPDKVFATTVELQFLDVSDNLISYIDEYILNNTVVEVFKFDRNRISTFNAYRFLSHALWLEEIYLDNNPWNCRSLFAAIDEFEQSQIYYEPGTRFDVQPNINGILCHA